MTYNEKLLTAIALLEEINKDWAAKDNDDSLVESYESRLPFDELIAELRAIRFKS